MLQATRTRISFSGEVLTAVAFLAATLLVGSLIVRQLRVAPRAVSAPAEAAAAIVVPPDAVAVPTLMLGTHEIKVGDSFGAALGGLDPATVLVKKAVQAGPIGPREIHAYQLGSTRFILIGEPFERGGATRVAAIYLQ